MKKICYVTTVSMTLQSFVLKTADYLYEKEDYDISFICSEDESFASHLPQYIQFSPVSMKRGISIGGIKAILKMYKIFRREKFDLVQYSTPNASCYASVAAWLARVPVRLYCQWGIAYVGFSGIKRHIFKSIEKLVCKLSTHVQPDSFGNLKFSHDEGLYPVSKGSVVWNGSASGVDLTKFDISQKKEWRESIRNQFSIPADAFVYGFVGRITGDKGINELFISAHKLLDKHDDVWLILVGNPEKSDSVNQELFNWAKNHERVVFCGYTNKVERYLSAMDTYLLPSYREGFGSGVIEAEAMGVPVIVTNIPGPTDAMLPGETGLVVIKKDIKTLIDAMENLYLDRGKCAYFGKNGQQFALERFEQRKLFEYILKDRESILNNEK